MLPEHFCDCPGHAAFGVVEMIAWIPFEYGVDAPGFYCIHDGGGAIVHLAHKGMAGMALPVSERNADLADMPCRSIVPYEIRESGIPERAGEGYQSEPETLATRAKFPLVQPAQRANRPARE